MSLDDLPVLGSAPGAPPKPVKGADRARRKREKARAGAAFRTAVLERDGYRCRLCGRPVRRTLDVLAPDGAQVHHLRGRNVAPEDRFNPKAALTTCSACHRKVHHQ